MEKTKHIMSKDLITIDPDASVNDAYQLMKNNWVRHLPVIDKTGKLLGIISDRDLLRATKSASIPKTSGKGAVSQSWYIEPEVRVRDFMASPAVMFDRDTPIQSIVEKMIKDKVSAFVISEKDQPIGIVTTDDCLHLLQHLLSEDTGNWTWNNWYLSPAFQNAVHSIGQTGI